MNDRRQVDKFCELARELETDDDEGPSDERLGKLAKATKTARAGYWRVESLDTALGHEPGHHAIFHADTDIGTWEASPTFPTPEAVYQWLHDRGCQQDPLDPDVWRD